MLDKYSFLLYNAPMTTDQRTKPCSKCKQVKPLSEFHRNRSKASGVDSICKACARSRSKLRINYHREYRQTEKGKAAEARRPYNPAKKKVNNKINQLVRMGRMPRVSTLRCIECNEQAQEYHHHNGYGEAHQLDVVPLCRHCHAATRSQ